MTKPKVFRALACVMVAVCVAASLAGCAPGDGAGGASGGAAGAPEAPVAAFPADGEYLVDVSLEGGTGRASVTSPALVSLSDGAAIATIEWSSPNYDYMLVGGARFLPTNDGGNSTFRIPVPDLSEPLDVVADTTAMSQPHEIAYRLTFDPSSATPYEP